MAMADGNESFRGVNGMISKKLHAHTAPGLAGYEPDCGLTDDIQVRNRNKNAVAHTHQPTPPPQIF